MDGEKKRKRAKRIVEHANPLFDSWLLEWQKDADKRGSNMKYNFQRARKSLSLYPLPLRAGQDCKLLAHFGNKICDMLDKRLAQHEREFGSVDWSQVHQMKETPKKGKKRKVNVPPSVVIPTPPITPARNTQPISTHSTGKTGSDKKERNKKQYVPLVRSGAYALLISLHQASLDSQYQGFMKKDELIAAAQPLCDVSLSKSEKVGCYYTGWSSMQTLVKKGLVLRHSHPPKFSLSDEGKALALRLEDAERTIDPIERCNPLTAGTGNQKSDDQSTSCPVSTHTLSSSDSEDDGVMKVGNCSPSYNTHIMTPTSSSQTDSIKAWQDQEEGDHIAWRQEEIISGVSRSTTLNKKNYVYSKKQSAQISSVKPPDGLRFSYVTTLGMETPLKDCAGVTVEEDGFIGFLIKCIASDLQESGFSYRLDHTRTAHSGFVYAYLSNEFAPEQCIGLDKDAGTSSSGSLPLKATHKRQRTKPQKNGLPLHPSGSTDELQMDVNKEASPIISDHADAVSAAAAAAASPYVPFTLLPENYEIILCIDIAETTGKSAEAQPSNKDVILSELRRNGIKYSVRKLHVGDYLWVCQEIRPSLTANSGISAKASQQERRELVLPVIVERKRMDDLASSIKDGRFKEQKFRLMHCGLSHPVYLVEEDRGSVSGGLSLPEMSCLQAVVNTQVINGFTVKVVKGQRESAAYLTIMTRYLQSRYKNKTVSSAKFQDLKESQTNKMFEIETSMLSFSEFNIASMKTQQLTVREMFAKHLLQLYGISADKARAVVDKYGTPGLLMDAYDDEDNTEETKRLLAVLRWGKTGRSLGPVLSATISALYTSEVLR